MSKQHFFFKLIPPRSTFPGDITDAERRLMDEHGRYCREQFEEGRLLIYGPVLTAYGSFGLAVLEVENEGEARKFGEGDPSVKGGLNTFEISLMRVGAARGLKG